ncbi:DUF3245 domain-containing protein [Streptomyces sp. NL15-2K]|uniref:DUF3245 domain-containing protein n=1 Tax=Streptomyces sp. NL15-2K TaxID=376149 RepID=UPI00209BE80B|nr:MULTISPECIES: DUF3245 domain-containing protein [Actinomycetes]WKX07220.1 DUF3245 domain-containing protein [Kutzneria buriramensis]
MHPAEVSAEEVKAAQRAAMTRIEVVDAVREITVEVPGRQGLPGLRSGLAEATRLVATWRPPTPAAGQNEPGSMISSPSS